MGEAVWKCAKVFFCVVAVLYIGRHLLGYSRSCDKDCQDRRDFNSDQGIR